MLASFHISKYRAEQARQGRALDPVEILDQICGELPLRSIERDIVVCAELYLMGDKSPGQTVERWWSGDTTGEWLHPGVLETPNVERTRLRRSGGAG